MTISSSEPRFPFGQQQERRQSYAKGKSSGAENATKIVKSWGLKRHLFVRVLLAACDYALLLSRHRDETASHTCHSSGNMTVRMRNILATM